jgi:hypothetical protein
MKGSFVLLGCAFELAQEDMSVAKVAVSSSFGCLKTKQINLQINFLKQF